MSSWGEAGVAPTGHATPVSGIFPSSDHLPLGRPFGLVRTQPEPPSQVRPFGLTLAVAPARVTTVNTAEIGYDEDAQVGLIRLGDDMVPLSKHTDGQTNAVTQGGDGQKTNQDSDTDHRED
jgi:putative ATP-grasp target RiPP